jgi:hypothetical protein
MPYRKKTKPNVTGKCPGGLRPVDHMDRMFESGRGVDVRFFLRQFDAPVRHSESPDADLECKFVNMLN